MLVHWLLAQTSTAALRDQDRRPRHDATFSIINITRALVFTRVQNAETALLDMNSTAETSDDTYTEASVIMPGPPASQPSAPRCTSCPTGCAKWAFYTVENAFSTINGTKMSRHAGAVAVGSKIVFAPALAALRPCFEPAPQRLQQLLPAPRPIARCRLINPASPSVAPSLKAGSAADSASDRSAVRRLFPVRVRRARRASYRAARAWRLCAAHAIERKAICNCSRTRRGLTAGARMPPHKSRFHRLHRPRLLAGQLLETQQRCAGV